MRKFPKIGRLNNLQYLIDKGELDNPGVVEYTGTVKLHGTNAGLALSSGVLTPQSRNRTLSVGSDSFGFAVFVKEREQELLPLFPGDGTLYGEWVGPGVQKKVACSLIPERRWVLFGFISDSDPGRLQCPADPLSIPQVDSVYNLDQYAISVDFGNPDIDTTDIDAYTAQIDGCCPYGQALGVDGPGEGIVWVPRCGTAELIFKSKGEAHHGGPKVPKEKPQVTAEELGVVDVILDERRLGQGIEYLVEMSLPLDLTSTGAFISFIKNDIEEECAPTLEGVDKKRVFRLVSGRAAVWFKSHVGRPTA